MSGLLTRPGPPVRAQTPAPRWLVSAGAAAAGVAAAVALAVLAAVTVLLWAVGPHPGVGLSAVPFRAACSWWLLAQHATAQGPAGPFSIAPLTLTAAALVLCVGTARWAARVAGASDVGGAVVVAVGFTGTHMALAALAAGFADGGALVVHPGDAVRAAAAFGGSASVVGVATRTDPWIRLVARLEVLAAPAVRAAVVGLLVLLGGGAGIVGGSLAVHHESTAGVFRGIGGGWSGAIGLVLLCLAFLPNAAVWAVSVAAGPGIGLGTGAGLDLFGARPGALPSFPLLGALPQSSPLPAYLWALTALPVAAGVALGWAARPVPPLRGWTTVLLTPLAAAVATGAVVGLLGTWSGGSAGGRLSSVGPAGGVLGLMVTGELAVCAVAVAAARYGRERHHARIAAGAVPAKMLPAARRPGAVENLAPATPVPKLVEGKVVAEPTGVNLVHPGRPEVEARLEGPQLEDAHLQDGQDPEPTDPDATAEIPIHRGPEA